MSVSLCPHCRKNVSIPPAAIGKKLACPHCKTIFACPGASDIVAGPPPVAKIAPPLRNAAPIADSAEIRRWEDTGRDYSLALPFVWPLRTVLWIVGGAVGTVGVIVALVVLLSGTGKEEQIAEGLPPPIDAPPNVRPEEPPIVKVAIPIDKPEPKQSPAPKMKPPPDKPLAAKPKPAVKIPAKIVPPEWADASTSKGEALMVGNEFVLVKFESATIGFVELANLLGRMKSKDRLLAIKVNIFNGSETRKVEYTSWGLPNEFAIVEDRLAPRMVDNFGNKHRRLKFGFGIRVVESDLDGKRFASIYPKKLVSDVLIFDLPVERAEWLRLELPGEAVGGHGVLKFQIPRSMIAWPD